MKIEIELKGSTEANITIDGRKMRYGYKASAGCWTFLEGMNPGEGDNTIGGMVACKLASPLIDILQAWLPEEESPDGDCWGTWETLSESAAEEVEERMS